MKRISLCLLLCSAMTVPACASSDSDEDAEAAIDDAETASAEAALVATVGDDAAAAAASGASAEEAAAAASAAVACPGGGSVSSSQQGATVTYVFADCTGPYGLAGVNGELTATYALADSELELTLAAESLQVNDAVVSVDAVAAFAADGTVAVTSTIAATGPLGRQVKHQGDYQVNYDEASACIALDGTFTTGAAIGAVTTTVTGFESCAALCPTGSLSVTLPRRTLTLSFDGSDEAEFSSSNGAEGAIALPYCEPS